MAVFKESVSSFNAAFDLSQEPMAPAGTYLATCIDCKDQFGIVRQKFQSQETETVDLTAFLFGFRDQEGRPYKVATANMKISGNEKSALYLFLKQWLGKPFPFGQDYAQPEQNGGMIGRKALITVSHEPKKSGDGVWVKIIGVSPVPAGFGAAPVPAPTPVQPALAAPAAPAVPAATAPVLTARIPF